MRSLKRFYTKNYEAIKLGMLVGLLVSNIFLISRVADNTRKQVQTTEFIKEQIARDNEARKQSRKENKEADKEFRVFICSLIRDLLEAGNSATKVDSLDSCEANIISKDTSSDISPVPQKPQLQSRQNPTTSEPPDKPAQTTQPQADSNVTLGDVLKEIPNVPIDILKSLGDLL